MDVAVNHPPLHPILLNFIAEMMQFKEEMVGFKEEMLSFKEEMLSFKEETRSFKTEMMIFKTEMLSFKGEMLDFKAKTETALAKHTELISQLYHKAEARDRYLYEFRGEMRADIANLYALHRKVAENQSVSEHRIIRLEQRLIPPPARS